MFFDPSKVGLWLEPPPAQKERSVSASVMITMRILSAGRFRSSARARAVHQLV